MKKIHAILLVAAALTAATTTTWAQNGRSEHQTNWFIGAGAGMNFGFDGQQFSDRETSHNGAGTAADFYVGKYFNDNLGFRVGYHGFKTSNHYTDYNKDKFHYAHADLIFRAGNLFTPYVHAGYAWLGKGTPAAGLGFMLPIRLGSRVSIIPDFKATALNAAAFTDGTKRLGLNLSATVGVQIALGKIKKKAAPAPVEIYPVPAPYQEPVKDTVVVTVRDTVIVEVPVEVIKEKEPAIPSFNKCVQFDFNSVTLTPAAKNVLDQAVAILKNDSTVTAHIEGNTDSIGSEAINQKISVKRAQAVADYLVNCGIDASRITSEGFGKTRPVDTNATKKGRARNRRVEIRINAE